MKSAVIPETGLAPLEEAAIAHLNNNDVLKNALGSELAQAFIAVRQAEWEGMKNMEIEEEVKILLSRY